MNAPKPETAAEATALKVAVKQVQREWGFPPSFGLSALLDAWRQLVTDVEAGYALGLEDYAHALALRDSIEEIAMAVPERLMAELRHLLAPFDDRLRLATRLVSGPLLPGQPPNFWWSRIPKEPRGMLREELQSEGLL